MGEASVTEAQIVEAMRRVHFAIRRTGYYPYEEYEDMQAAGYLGIAEASTSWRPDGGASFFSYCDACVVHKLLKFLRRYRKQERIRPPEPPLAAYSDGPHAVMASELHRHIQTLPEPLRETLLQSLAEDHDQSSTFYTRRTQAVRILRDKMRLRRKAGV